MEIWLTILGVGEQLLRRIFALIYWYIERQPPRIIPENTNSVLNLSATILAQKIRTKQLKSEDIVRIYINRIREVNPVLNAVVEDCFQSALIQAKEIDVRIANSAQQSLDAIETEQPLLGVPITIKESCGLKGFSFCVGQLSRSGIKCSEDGEVVAYLKSAGAIPLAVTNTPELCLSWESANLVTGSTRNPYNTHRTSGGSSGGEGALLGAGASVIGVGTDIAGSIRVPAQFNGIYGHKPTGGIVSVKGHYPNSTDKEFSKYLVIGPMTRYAQDLRVLLKIMAGNNAQKLNLDENVDLSKLTVYHMEELGNKTYDIPVQRDLKEKICRAVNYLNQCGSTGSDVKFPELYDSIEISISVFFSVLKDIPNTLQNPTNPKEKSNLYLELLKSMLGLSKHSYSTLLFYFIKETNLFIPHSKAPFYQQKLAELKTKLQKTLDSNGVFLYPTFPTSAFNHYGLICNAAGISYTMLFNLLGFPSTHVPLGLDSNNLPVGLQVIANHNQDKLCLKVAEELEKEFGGWIPPPTTKYYQ